MATENQPNGIDTAVNENTEDRVDQENDSERIISELTKANVILKANISTLYRTARAEIARKDDRIAELQSELDNLLFRRMNSNNNDSSQPNQGYSKGPTSDHVDGAENLPTTA